MNKVTKGALAAGAAGALLLGGIGTYATWSDSKTVNAGTVSTGQLTLAATDPSGWVYEGTGAAVTAEGIVPGDTVTSSYTVTVDAEGDNIAGVLTIAEFDDSVYPGATVTVTPDLTAVAEGAALAADGTLTFSQAGEYVFDVDLKIFFDQAGGTGAGLAPIDLTKLGLELKQTL